jgi:hypothetical protein
MKIMNVSIQNKKKQASKMKRRKQLTLKFWSLLLLSFHLLFIFYTYLKPVKISLRISPQEIELRKEKNNCVCVLFGWNVERETSLILWQKRLNISRVFEPPLNKYMCWKELATKIKRRIKEIRMKFICL